MTEPEPQAVAAPRGESFKRTWRRRWIRVAAIAAGLVTIWLVGDWVYSRVVLRQLERYESSFTWDDNGVRQGEEAFEIGRGETALLMVHGINFSPIAYRNLAPDLAARGFTCRAMRLPGFGMHLSEYGKYDAADWIDAVDREVRELSRRHERVVVVAHSLGAAIVLRYLLERQPPIDGLVLIAPAIEVSDHRSPVFPTRFWHEFSKRALLSTRIVLSPFEYDVHDPAVLGTIPPKQFTPRAVVDQTFDLIDRNRGQASRIQVPLLMLLSPSDQVISTPAAQAYFDNWGTADKVLQLQPDAGHMIPLDFGWRDAATAIAEFAKRPSSDSHSDPSND
jgi:carboxylesterase